MSDDVKPYTREELDALVLQIKEIGTDGIEQEWMRRPASDASPHWLDRLLATARAGLEAAEAMKKRDDFVAYAQRQSVARANRWHDGDFRQWSGLEWAGAMCGEAGEAANVAKKLRRVELAIDGNAASERPLVPTDLVQKLSGECADVFLYLVLLAARYDIDLTTAIVETFNKKSVEMGFPERLERSAVPATETAMQDVTGNPIEEAIAALEGGPTVADAAKPLALRVLNATSILKLHALSRDGQASPKGGTE